MTPCPKKVKNKAKIWTIGHGRRSVDCFLKLLKKHRIQVLVDVRRFPTSRLEHFRSDVMRQWLQKEGISYVWLGNELGGYRSGGYEKHMNSEIFVNGVSSLLKIAQEKNTCIMCLEVDPKYCHRRFISRYIENKGFEIIHIT